MIDMIKARNRDPAGDTISYVVTQFFTSFQFLLDHRQLNTNHPTSLLSSCWFLQSRFSADKSCWFLQSRFSADDSMTP